MVMIVNRDLDLKCSKIRKVQELTNISQGSVAKSMRCAAIFVDFFIAYIYCSLCQWKTVEGRSVLGQVMTQTWCLTLLDHHAYNVTKISRKYTMSQTITEIQLKW